MMGSSLLPPLSTLLPPDYPQPPKRSLPQIQSSQDTLFLHILDHPPVTTSKTQIKKSTLPFEPASRRYNPGGKSGDQRVGSSREEKESRSIATKNDASVGLEQEPERRDTNRKGEYNAGYIGLVLNNDSVNGGLGAEEIETYPNRIGVALNEGEEHAHFCDSDGGGGAEKFETYADPIGFALNEGEQHAHFRDSGWYHVTTTSNEEDINVSSPSIRHAQSYESGSGRATSDDEEGCGSPSRSTPDAVIDGAEEENNIARLCEDDISSGENAAQGEKTRRSRYGASPPWEKIWQYEGESDAEPLMILSEETYSETISAVLEIARNLPRNVTLQEKLDCFGGRIDVICGNAILYRLAKEGLYWQALSCFEWMRLHSPSLIDSRSLCTIFAMLGDADMVERGLVLFENFKACGEQLLSVQAFNALLSALSKHRRFDEVERVFQEMSRKRVEPDSVTLCILLNSAHKRGCDAGSIWKMFCDMEEQAKVVASVEVFGVLVKAFCDRGMLAEGLGMMGKMEARGMAPNVVIYNTLVDALGKAGKLEEAEGLVSEMKARSVGMSAATYNALIAAYANRGRFEAAEALLNEMAGGPGVKPTVRSYTALMSAYGRRALSEKASAMFLKMRRRGIAPNSVSYAALIHAHAEAGWHSKAEHALESMLRDGLTPTPEIYTSLLHGYRLAADADGVKRIWHEMRRRRCAGTRPTFNVIMDAFAKCGRYAEARDAMFEFARIGLEPDLRTYNMLLNAYARGFRHRRLPGIVAEMRSRGLRPDSFTYTTLIFSFLRVRDFSAAFRYHDEMCAECQLPDAPTYRKLRSILDAKLEVRTQRNVRAVVGAQRNRHAPVSEANRGKRSWERRKAALPRPRR